MEVNERGCIKDFDKDPGLLTQALECWEGMADFRRDRDRNKRFTYGDQWSDTVKVDGRSLREDEYIMEQGNMPLKNNLIRRLVRNVLGVFRNRWQIPVCVERDSAEMPEAATLQALLEYNMELNRLEEVYARTMEEFLISGLAVHRKWFGVKGGQTDCWTDFVQPDNFFSDAGSRDFRGWDISIIGEIHDMDFPTLASEFARTEEEFKALERIYGGDTMDSSKRCCRVVEVWRKEYKQCYRCHDRVTGRFFISDIALENPSIKCEWLNSEQWHGYFIAPGGEILSHSASPYSHGGHPYVMKAYPYVDGEIHSFVSDIIDQQKFTNRLISMYDWILRASAKGVLLFPEGSLPQGSDINDVAEEWSRFNGVIVYRPKAGVPLPQQISSGSAQTGIADLLNIQMKLMEDISGVNGALQRKVDSGTISGTLYNQQTENSMMALTDLLKSFDGFIKEATKMDLSNIKQFYDSEKIKSIVGSDSRYVANLNNRKNFSGDERDYRILMHAGS